MANPIRTRPVILRKAFVPWRLGAAIGTMRGSATAAIFGVGAVMIRVGILGASGYSALELIKILLRHPEVKITALTTRQTESPSVGEIHPSLAGRLDLALETLSSSQVAELTDCVFCCLPHGASASAVAELLPAGKKVIDLSADYRLNDPAVYKQWYAVDHPDP